MPRRTLLSSLAALLTLLAWTVPSGPLASPRFPNRPKLVVVLVIDQFRYDYLMRYQSRFVAGGFNKLLDEGAVFTDCRYDYAVTMTGPGHATLLTGAYANLHGIIENRWYDRALQREVYCVEDPTTRTVAGRQGAGTAPGFSPRHLIGSTLGDELRAATDFRSKVISISFKDRAAVLMGGHSPTAVYWYDTGSGGFVTSTYYASVLPDWVDSFNQENPAKIYCGGKWQALPETPGASGVKFPQFESSPGEPCPDPKFLGWLEYTPFMNQIELAFAREAIRSERLGQGSETDMLAVSLTANDYIGHRFGPYSPEVADTTLRTDHDLAVFLADLDKLVGLDNVWIALTSDHGVAPNPGFIQEHKLGLGNAQTAAIRSAAEQALTGTFGPGPWVEDEDEAYIYLNRETLKKRNVPEVKAEDVAARAATALPEVVAAFPRTQLLTGGMPISPVARKVANSFNLKRGGDIFLVLAPYAVPVSGIANTMHGTPWNYDAQVPLVFWGSAFKPGVYATACQPIDMTATLAAILGLTQPSGTQGVPRTEALK